MTGRPTPIQRAALDQAASRQLGTPWRGPRDAAERCCDLGWLEAQHLPGSDAKDPASVIYVLTANGRAVLALA